MKWIWSLKLSGNPATKILIKAFGLKSVRGVVQVDEALKTSQEKIYACGDVIFGNGQGEAMVVSAVEQGKTVAGAIHQSFRLQTEIA